MVEAAQADRTLATGLTSAEVAERVARGQTNAVELTTTRSVAQIVRANVFTRFNALLGGMLAIIIVVGPVQDALFGFVLIANALIGIVQELRAKRTLDRLTLLTAPRARVVRDGSATDLAVTDVVLDDLLVLEPGFQVVVDGEVVDGEGLEIDESLLTGEADPVEKDTGEGVRSGSFVAAGSGSYRATAVGPDAYAVRLAQEARRFAVTRSELIDGINRILTWVTWAIIPTATLLFISQLRNASDWRTAVAGAVAGTVAMVPEGLVLLTSLAFAVAAVRLARRRVLVKELPAVEGLARIDVLCIDKTGTLTEGKLEVASVEVVEGASEAEAAELLAALAAADAAPNSTMRAIADRFEAAPAGWTASGSVPFSSARKWSAVAFEDRGVLVLGAPDVLLAATGAAAAGSRAEQLAGEGHRVVLLARARATAVSSERLPEGLTPVALVILGDRIRPSAEQTLRYFAEQEVRVTVISGDDARTVGAIATRLGLEGADRPVDARELPDDAGELAAVLEDRSVFGRVTPEQKRAMVRALQGAGHVVAMTGDGVNDALALKDADIGVAMGSGTEATRGVAQLVLLDSDFDALPPVVAEGRRVLGNIERTSGLYLTKTVYAMLLSLAVGVVGFAFPFLPRHLTLVGALTIGIPSFFLALAPNTDRFRPGFVGRVMRFAVPAGTLAAIAVFIAYAVVREEPGVTLLEARTAAVMVLTWIGLLVLSICAAPLNAWKLGLIVSMAGLFLLAMVLPVTQEFFALQTPPLIVWLAAFGIAAIVWSFARLFVVAERPVGPGAIGRDG
jgi:cation-transporting ATPase E